jgi:hypothetical protein
VPKLHTALFEQADQMLNRAWSSACRSRYHSTNSSVATTSTML